MTEIIVSPSDTDYIDQLIPSIREYSHGNKTSQLLGVLSDFASDREAEIERQCNTNHQEFVTSVSQLLRIRQGTVNLTTEILDLNQSIQASTENLVEQKKALVESRGVRQNIDEASRTLQDCLEVLRLANQVHDLLAQKKHYAALRALDELQSVHLESVTQYKLSTMIQKSVPATQKAIAEAVMADLKTWLYRIREMSQYLGELSFYHTDLRNQRQKERAETVPYLSHFRLNSAIELVSDEHEEYDLLNNDDLQVDFTPLFEALHIYQSVGQMDRFRSEYAFNRKRQKDLLLPSTISLIDDDLANLHTLLEDIAGFAIVERATMKRIPDLRSTVDVEELWDSLCQTAVSLIGKALPAVDNAEHLLKVKNLIALFMQTMNSWNFQTTIMQNFLLVLFNQYAELLKKRFSEDFLEIVSTDDYMPMPINNVEEFEKVVNVSWYTPDRPAEEMNFPCVFPFSQMYPLCCIDIRNFLNQFYFFSADQTFSQPETIDARLKDALDELLCTKVCNSLVQKLSSQYLGQIVQILINLEHFETACTELETLLVQARSAPADTATTSALSATVEFRSQKKTAENRIFELVNSKVDDLIETAEYDWLSGTTPTKPSEYIQGLTQYLSNIMNSVLLSLPTEIKELMLFNAISHTSEKILSLPLSPSVRKINPNGVKQLAIDVDFLYKYIGTLPNSFILGESLEELQQTIALLQTDTVEDFYDVSLRNKKYRQVNPQKAPELLEKLTREVEQAPARAAGTASARLAAFQNRFMHNDGSR
jgi:exocyst complex component 6